MVQEFEYFGTTELVTIIVASSSKLLRARKSTHRTSFTGECHDTRD